MTKLENGLTVKRLDNGMIGVLEFLGGTAWKINYLDGTASYGSESKIKENVFIQKKQIEVKGYTVVDLPVNDEPTIEDSVKTYGDDGIEPDNGLIDQQDHYTNNGIQPIEIMKANMSKEKYRGFLEGNILKYPLRYEDKNGLDDLKKAKTYLTWLIEDIEERGL